MQKNEGKWDLIPHHNASACWLVGLWHGQPRVMSGGKRLGLLPSTNLGWAHYVPCLVTLTRSIHFHHLLATHHSYIIICWELHF